MRLALRLVLVAAIGVGMVVIGVGGLVLWPRLDLPPGADAVVVLSGDHGERLRTGLELVERDVAPTLVLVGAPDFPAADAVCSTDDASRSFEVVCLRPNPDPNTRGQARATAALAAQRRWRTLAVVTSKQHVERARLMFDRCFPGELDVVGAELPPQVDRTQTLAHEWLGLVHAVFVSRGC